MDFRPELLAKRHGWLKKASNTLCLASAVVLLAGIGACFLVPQSKIGDFKIVNRLYGLSNDDEARAGRPLTRRMIMDGLGVSKDAYCLFASEETLENNLASCWFVSPCPAPKVNLGPFSCEVSFQDVFPLAMNLKGDIFLSSGESYSKIASSTPELGEAYPQEWLDSMTLFAFPDGVVDGYDYTKEFSTLLQDLAPLDPELLASGALKYARFASNDSYFLYLDFGSGLEIRLRVYASDLKNLTYSGKLLPMAEAMRSYLGSASETHTKHADAGDEFTGRAWFRLCFGKNDNTGSRYGIFWEEEV